MHINFVIDPSVSAWEDLERLSEADIERAPRRFVGGRNSWIAQTFLRLREPLSRRGWRVTAQPRFVAGSITVVHRDDLNSFGLDAHRSFLIAVRADRPPAWACDLAIAQNTVQLGSHERFIPLWPQPGLVPRDRRRGSVVEHLAYHGRIPGAPTWFYDADMHRELSRRGVRFKLRDEGWDRYAEVDVVVAARQGPPNLVATKPATKLYNGWLAGVPVLAAAEPAYLEVRRGPLDFMTIAGPLDLLRGVRLLQDQPRLYDAMVANGRLRATEFDIDATRRRWIDLLEGEVAQRFERQQAALGGRAGWFAFGMARQRFASRVCKIQNRLAAAG